MVYYKSLYASLNAMCKWLLILKNVIAVENLLAVLMKESLKKMLHHIRKLSRLQKGKYLIIHIAVEFFHFCSLDSGHE